MCSSLFSHLHTPRTCVSAGYLRSAHRLETQHAFLPFCIVLFGFSLSHFELNGPSARPLPAIMYVSLSSRTDQSAIRTFDKFKDKQQTEHIALVEL